VTFVDMVVVIGPPHVEKLVPSFGDMVVAMRWFVSLSIEGPFHDLGEPGLALLPLEP
jgi:hypothetical protein